jgi:formamidopyrimidine-DNA glycosylase
MPELPEVETMRRGIAPIVGSRIVAVSLPRCTRRPIALSPRIDHFRRRVVGRNVLAIDRIGKRVVVRIEENQAILFEPRMTGLVLLADPPTREHLRFHLQLTGGAATDLWYWDRRGLGSVRLLHDAEIATLFGTGKLGPDALSLTANELQARFAGSRREIKVALLDQRAIAGVGNLYASEILHLAGVHPQQRCDRLRAEHWVRIHAALIEVLETAIRYEGSTLGDGTYRNALNKEGGYQNHHRVYARAGERCPSCAAANIVRIVQAQRSTFYCGECQRKGKRRAGRA